MRPKVIWIMLSVIQAKKFHHMWNNQTDLNPLIENA